MQPPDKLVDAPAVSGRPQQLSPFRAAYQSPRQSGWPGRGGGGSNVLAYSDEHLRVSGSR